MGGTFLRFAGDPLACAAMPHEPLTIVPLKNALHCELKTRPILP
jgi:hypothetical protein